MVINFVNKRTTVEVEVVGLSSSSNRLSIANNCTVMSFGLGPSVKLLKKNRPNLWRT